MKYALRLSRWIRPLIEKRAARLWVEDVAYAERRAALSAAEARTLNQYLLHHPRNTP